jgi:hypothetical protein
LNAYKKVQVLASSDTHSFNYSATGATITATCSADDCPLPNKTATLTLTAPTLTTYGQTSEGISANATLTGLDAFNAATGLDVAATNIKYYNVVKVEIEGSTYERLDTDHPLNAAPTDAGKYGAGITLENVKTSAGEGNRVRALVSYTIAKAAETAPTADAAKAHEILLCVQTGKTMSDGSHFKFEGDGYHVPKNEEFINNFSFLPESIANQAEIANKCKFRFKKKDITMPAFPTGNKSMEDLFVEECWKGFHERFDGTDIDVNLYKERLEHEMSIIAQMKFQAYFLIVADFIGYAKKNGIAVGPGRGSAVGSLVSYCLKITNLDPIPYGLLFERKKIALVKPR